MLDLLKATRVVAGDGHEVARCAGVVSGQHVLAEEAGLDAGRSTAAEGRPDSVEVGNVNLDADGRPRRSQEEAVAQLLAFQVQQQPARRGDKKKGQGLHFLKNDAAKKLRHQPGEAAFREAAVHVRNCGQGKPELGLCERRFAELLEAEDHHALLPLVGAQHVPTRRLV